MQLFSNLFIYVRSSTCFRRFFRPSSGVQNCTYSVSHLSDRYCYLLLEAMHKPMNVVFFISFRCLRFPVSNIIQRVLYSKTWVSIAKILLCIFPLFSRSLVSPTYTVCYYSAVNCRREQTINLYSDFQNSPRKFMPTNCVHIKLGIGIGQRKYFNALINLLFVKC